MAFCEDPPLLISPLADGNMRKHLQELQWDQAVGRKCPRGVAQGMAFLHSIEVVHGDLKCSNVLMRKYWVD